MCRHECFSEDFSVISTTLVKNNEASNGDITLSIGDDILLSGYQKDFHPIRQLPNKPRVTTLELSCGDPDSHTTDDSDVGCYALVAVTGSVEIDECGINSDEEAYCKSYSNILFKGIYKKKPKF